MYKHLKASKRSITTWVIMTLSLIGCCFFTACGQQPTGNISQPQKLATEIFTSSSLSSTSFLTTSSIQSASLGKPIPSEPLRQIRFVDQKNGWALTNHAILRTSDGGANWLDVTKRGPGGSQMDGGEHAVAVFQNATRAWLFNTVRTDVNYAGLDIIVWRTLDAGKNWARFTFNDPDAIFIGDRPHFMDALHGWLLLNRGNAAGSEGVHLYRTIDGGQTWTRIASAPGTLPLPGIKAGPTFESASYGWMADAIGAELDDPLLYQTMDAGYTWSANKLPTLPGVKNALYQTTPPVYLGTLVVPVHLFLMQGKGLAIYLSTNNGSSWHINWTTKFDTDNVYVVNLTHYWALDQGTLYATTDSGANWSVVAHLPTTASTMSFTSSQVGWIIDSSSTVLYHTIDGGHTWTTLHYTFHQ